MLDRLVFCVVSLALIAFAALTGWAINQMRGWYLDDGPE